MSQYLFRENFAFPFWCNCFAQLLYFVNNLVPTYIVFMFCILYLNVSLYQSSIHSEPYNSAGLKPLAAPPFYYIAKRIYMANKIVIFRLLFSLVNILVQIFCALSLIRANHLARLVNIFSTSC
jgi:hypothetical protein